MIPRLTALGLTIAAAAGAISPWWATLGWGILAATVRTEAAMIERDLRANTARAHLARQYRPGP